MKTRRTSWGSLVLLGGALGWVTLAGAQGASPPEAPPAPATSAAATATPAPIPAPVLTAPVAPVAADAVEPTASEPAVAPSATPPPPPPVEPLPPLVPKPAAKLEIDGKLIYSFQLDRGASAPADRARTARRALDEAIKRETPDAVHVDTSGTAAVVYVGKNPIFQLSEDDARLVGDSSLRVHAEGAAVRLKAVLVAEQKRSHLARNVLSVSFAVLFSLIAIILLGRTSTFAENARSWIASHRGKIPALKVQSIELVGAGAVQSSATLGLEAAKWLVRCGIVYLWLWATLSQFSATTGYVEAFTKRLVSPLTDVAARVASSLPWIGIGLLAIGVVALALRFIDLFFTSASREETRIPYVTSDVARPLGTLLKLGVVLGVLLFAAPVLTGNDDGVLPRSAVVALGTLGLATTPLLASLAMGVAVIFSRQLKVGDHVIYGGKRGRVRAIGLLQLVLEAGPGVEMRIPHLLSLLHATKILGPLLRVGVKIPVAKTGSGAMDALNRAALSVGTQPQIELLAIGRTENIYSVSILSDRRDGRSALLAQCAQELEAAGIGLGELIRGAGPKS